MIPAFQFLATLCIGLFAGAALYINLVEHPARMALDPVQARRQWAPSYLRATWMQAPLALLACASAAAVAWLDGTAGWWLVAALIGAVVPFTFLVIMPTNHQLMALADDAPSKRVCMLLERWARLHAVRSVLSLLALLLALCLLIR